MDERLKDRHLVNELPATFLEVEEQLKDDDKRWGDEWKKRGLVFEGIRKNVFLLKLLNMLMILLIMEHLCLGKK